MRIVTSSEMRELDRRTIEEIGIPGVVLMENAGRGAAETLIRRYADLAPGPVVVFAGKGNNGGDGYVIARRLLDKGWKVRTIVLAPKESIAGDALLNLDALLKCGGDVVFAADEGSLRNAFTIFDDARVIVDALLGTGLASDVSGLYAVAIDIINEGALPVVAVDIPSGIDASTGRLLGRAVQADLTVTFAFPKVGHIVHPGASHIGLLETVDIGIPASLVDATPYSHSLIDAVDAAPLLPERPVTGHKGTFGHLLVVAGSTGKSGAAAMTAEGGLRIGSGLVTVACPSSVNDVLEVKLTEAMTYPLDQIDGALSLQCIELLRGLWDDKECVAIGPGLGRLEETAALVRHVVRECPIPLVIDADGLNAVAARPEVLRDRPAPTVLTPHPGEMARLAGTTIDEVEDDRIAIARRFAAEYGVVLVLKGAPTVTALPDGAIRVNSSGNPALASGGTGDVLTGLIAGLIAQGVDAPSAAVLGVYLHGRAADLLSERLGTAGMIATDLLVEIPSARLALSKV